MHGSEHVKLIFIVNTTITSRTNQCCLGTFKQENHLFTQFIHQQMHMY